MTDKIKNLNKLQEQTWTLLARDKFAKCLPETKFSISYGRLFTRHTESSLFLTIY